MIHWTSAGIPFVPDLWVLKSSVSAAKFVWRSQMYLVPPPISDNVYENSDLTAVVATVGARTEEPSVNVYREGMGKGEDDA